MKCEKKKKNQLEIFHRNKDAVENSCVGNENDPATSSTSGISPLNYLPARSGAVGEGALSEHAGISDKMHQCNLPYLRFHQRW